MLENLKASYCFSSLKKHNSSLISGTILKLFLYKFFVEHKDTQC
jgi:hypothetical protein